MAGASYRGGMAGFRRGAVATVAAVLCCVPLVAAPAGGGVEAGAPDPPVVGSRTRTFVDRSRPTPADAIAGITPSATRRLPTTFYYPARGSAADAAPAGGGPVPGARPARGRYPLVLFSPGSPGTAKDYEVLLAGWAAAGYVVAALQYPISSLAGPDAAAWADLPAQSDDARFVLRRVLRLDARKAGIPEVDVDRIAVAGHSFGGATALSLVSKCCRDARVGAVVVLAGVAEPVSGPKLRRPRGPAFFVHARYDRAVPYAPAAALCATVSGPKRLLTVEDARGLRAHVDPYLGDDRSGTVVRAAVVDFLDGYVLGKRAARDRLDRAGAGTTVGAVSRCPAPTTARA